MKLLLLAPLLAGCLPGGDTGGGTLSASWKIQKGDGTPDVCPSSYHTMKVSAAGFTDDFPSTMETPTVGLFDCAAGSGTGTIELPGGPDYNGTYAVWFEISDPTGDYVLMKDHRVSLKDSAKLRVDVSSGSATAEMIMLPNAGWLGLQWELYASMAMQRLTSCEAGGVDRIEIKLENDAHVTKTLSFPCTADNDGIELGDHMLGGSYTPFPAGDYKTIATAYSGATVVSKPRDPNTSGGDLYLHVPEKNEVGGGGLDFDLTTR